MDMARRARLYAIRPPQCHDLVSENQEEFTCLICTNILEFPVQTNCAHIACMKCFLLASAQQFGDHVTCPFCRQMLTDLHSDTVLARQVGSATVRCDRCGKEGRNETMRAEKCPSTASATEGELFPDGSVCKDAIRRLCGLPRFDQEVAFIDADYQRLLREMEANPLIERGPSVYGPDAHTGPSLPFSQGAFVEFWRDRFYFHIGLVPPGHCPHCGRESRHNRSRCKRKFTRCRRCGRRGHISTICQYDPA